jgi:molecular chaperone GrpE
MKEKRHHEHPTDGEAKGAKSSDPEPAFDGAMGAGNEAQAQGVDEVAQLRRQAAEAQDRYLRIQAELENTRKRMRREMDEERRYAELSLLADLLPVIDNIGRAIEAAEKSADAASLLSGFKMVSQQLNNVLDRHHLKPIKAEGEAFDPSVHEAIMQQPNDEHPENTVVAVGQSGYKLHDRVVRPAQVVVSKRSR